MGIPESVRIVSVLVLMCLLSGAEASQGLLNYLPRSDYQNFNLLSRESDCQNNLRPSLERLNRLKAQGHQIAFVTTGGHSIANPRLGVKDVFQGRRYLDSKGLLMAMEDFVRAKGLGDREQIRQEVKNCVRGRHRFNQILTESCTESLGTVYPHMGIVLLNSKTYPEPYVIHFYTNEGGEWFRPSIRVETIESYLKESNNVACKTKIVLPTQRAQRKIKKALQTHLPRRMFSTSSKGYNILSHPWGLATQNCNEWLAHLLAAIFHVPEAHWNSVSREETRDLLIETGFAPTKIVMNGGQSLAGVIAGFPGINAYEGNIDHFYGVGDGLPARTVLNWLNRQGLLQQQWLVQ